MTAFSEPPDPSAIRSADHVAARLRLLRAWAGNPSYAAIARKVNATWRAAGLPTREWSTAKNTVADCFRARPRPNDELLIAIVAALHPEPEYLARWRQALRIVRGQLTAASFVTALDQLPDDLPDFVGRTAELRELMMLAGGQVTSVEGMPGVGKTSLAIRAGHRLSHSGRFDQTLYVDLRGFHVDPGQPPADPAAVLAELLRLLGTPAEQIPTTLDSLSAAYQERLRGGQILIVLDNAANEDQVRSLIADSKRCVTLITSRDDMAGLAKVRHLPLDAFPATDAVRLLRNASGEARYSADPASVEQIAEVLGCLPLALAVMASRIRAHPWPLADHLDWLTGRFDVQHGTDRVTPTRLQLADRIQLAIGLSYAALTPQAQRILRLFALHPGPDSDPYAAAALANCHPAQAMHDLAHLHATNLLQQRQPGRYLLHEVVRAYGVDRAHDEEAGSERRAAIARLLDHYRFTAAAAMELCSPYEKARQAQSMAVAVTSLSPASVPLADIDTAAAWLAAELPNLLACAEYASTGWPAHTVEMSLILYPYLQERSRYRDARTLHAAALQAARSRADRSGEGQILVNLGLADFWLGRYPEALERFGEGLAVARASKDGTAEGRALANLAETYGILGHHPQALDYFQQALMIIREIGDRAGECRILSSIGTTYGRLGQFPAAIRNLRHALTLAREIGDQDSESRTLANMGFALSKLGRHAAAAAYLCQAVTILEDIADRNGLGYTLNFVGTNYRLMGRPNEALGYHRRAWTLAHEVGNPMLQAAAHDELGDAHRDLGQPELARIHWEQALMAYRQLGVPDAAQTEAKLDVQYGAFPPS